MCGCNNKGIRGAGRNPVVLPRNNVSIQGTNARTSAVKPQTPPPTNNLTSDRRTIERQRREVILKKLGRL